VKREKGKYKNKTLKTTNEDRVAVLEVPPAMTGQPPRDIRERAFNLARC
jgi:hypothetical protein